MIYKKEKIDLDNLLKEDNTIKKYKNEDYNYEDYERYGFNLKELSGYTNSMASVEKLKILLQNDDDI